MLGRGVAPQRGDLTVTRGFNPLISWAHQLEMMPERRRVYDAETRAEETTDRGSFTAYHEFAQALASTW
jgi:hypothetical protein